MTDAEVVSAVINVTGLTQADIKKITSTHVHTWSGRKIPHTLQVQGEIRPWQ